MARPARNIEDKRAAILAAAKAVIIAKGYGGTSLDAIVEHAGCSKSAIYELFGSKAGLLSALTEDVVRELAAALENPDHRRLPLDEALRLYAKRAMELILSDEHTAVVHLIISETWQLPNLGRAYYRLGPSGAQRVLAKYLRTQMIQGRLRTADPERAAVHFYGLLLWDQLNPRIVGAKRMLTAAEIEREAATAVNNFLRLYAAESPPKRLGSEKLEKLEKLGSE